MQPPVSARPLRVAVVGSGPAGFYATDHLLKADVPIEVDLLERLPTPFGLVRGGVAPDHQKIKNVVRVYDRTAADERVRFLGGVEVGRDVSVADLRRHYHAVVLTTGAQTDRSLGIPGEDLPGSHPATEFVAWYNGHPDFEDFTFDLSAERAVVIGVGNVAVDVARVLLRTPDELARTDIADYALDALRESRVREVVMVGRRGPAQAAFTLPEIRELGELEAADVAIPADEAALDPLSEEDLEGADRQTQKLVGLVQELSAREPTGRPKRLVLRFYHSPTEILGASHVEGIRLVRNELYRAESGRLRPRPTEDTETLSAGLVFRSVGYRGVAVPGVPFDERWGTIPNARGRITQPDTERPMPGLYAAGWIKRGPSGVIGTNKACAAETADALLEDAAAGRLPAPADPGRHTIDRLLAERHVRPFTYADWQRLDALEQARGEPLGRPRVKFTNVAAMRAALERTAEVG